MKYIRTKDGKIFDLKTTPEHLFVVRDKTKEGKNCYVSWLWNDWKNYFLIDGQNCVLFSYNSAQSFISDLMLKNLNYNNLVIELHPSYKKYKQADTIAELCDVFVIENEYCGQVSQSMYFDFEKAKQNIDITSNDVIYGALTIAGKGIIYVARMNDKGDLELL